jgi:N-acetylmuramoyl-L-alanine amidase
MKYKTLFVLLIALISSPIFSLSINIRSFDHENYTRIVFEGDSAFQFSYKNTPVESAIEMRLEEEADVENQIETFRRSEIVDRVVHRVEQDNGDKSVSVFKVHLKKNVAVKRNFVLERPYRVVFDLVGAPAPQTPAKKSVETKSKPGSKPEVNQDDQSDISIGQSGGQQEIENQQQEEFSPDKEEPEFPLPKQNRKIAKIERICIDPGHGGTDLGAVGRSNVNEKELTLKVSKKLKKLIDLKLGLRVIMTREKDEEVSLNSRVSKANNEKAQMFVSIHVNSSYRKSARGSETFFVSLKATDQEAFQLSQKENESFKEDLDKLATNADDDLKMILWNMAQTEYIKESSKLADYIQSELNVLLDTKNRGVKQAPFRVLMRAAMPAVLVEIAFISNAREEAKLQTEEFLDKVAYALYTGISKYIYYHKTLYNY